MPNRARRRSHLQVSQTKAETATSHQLKCTIDFSSVQNIDERAVLETETAATPRHALDLAFFLTEPERQAHERAVDDALVNCAFGVVQARHLIAARR